jgi:flagellar hook-associated protein 3 FlgL
MRISTRQAHESGIDNLAQRQTELAELQQRMTTGKRVARASDDPAAAARAERAMTAVERATVAERATEASRVVMVQVESALGDASSLLQRARELAVAAGNASYSDAERMAIANEMRSLRSQLLDVANRDDGAGTWLFGGKGSAEQPFVDAAGGVVFAGAGGTTTAEAASGLPLTTDGQRAWLAARTGNGVFETGAGAMVRNATVSTGNVSDPSALTGDDYDIVFTVSGTTTTYAVLRNGNPTAVTAAPYVSGQSIAIDGMALTVSGTPATGDTFTVRPSTPDLSVFGALDAAATALETRGRTGAQIAQSNARSLTEIDAVLGNLQGARAAAGQVLGRIDSEVDRLAGRKLASQAERSNAEDADMVHTVSDFKNRQTGYDAALQSYAMVQRLSLFDYVGGR